MADSNGLINPVGNLDMSMEGSVLVIKIETDEAKLSERFSGSGKSRTLATSGGNIAVRVADGMAKLGLNMYRKI